MKLLRHIILPVLFLIGLSLDAFASAGDPTVTLFVAHAIERDTADPEISNASDTTELVAVVADEKSDSGETDPPGKTPVVANDTTGEEDAEGEFYTEFDTTSVHSEKFDVLNFNDSVLIVLNDEVHGKYVHPFNGRATSKFGFRKYRYHLGVDIDLETGDSVVSCFDGKVRIAQYSKSYGNVVVVRHENGLETYYAHLSRIDVKIGQDVKAGDLLGLGGNTGHSHGSHLHFETRFKGQPFDPNMIIDFDRMCLRADTYYLSKSNFKYMSEVHKVKHYSRKKKKTWYTYYNAGGPEYATTDAKNNMNSVPDPQPADAANPPATTAPAPLEKKDNSTTAPKNDSKEVKPAPAAKTTPAPKGSGTSSKSTATYHTVKKGDTLSAIALKNGTTVDKICKLNNIKANGTLQIGQKIRVK